MVVNGLLVLALFLVCAMVYRSLVQLINYHFQQKAHAEALQTELAQARSVYATVNRRFERAFDASQRTALLKERYGLVHPLDRPVKWQAR